MYDADGEHLINETAGITLKLYDSVAGHQLLSGFLTNSHLTRVSRMPANDKGNNEIIPGCEQISWHLPYG